MLTTTISRDSSWHSVQDAVAAFRRKVKHIAGPTRAERQALLRGGKNEERLEGLVQGWAAEQFGKSVLVMVGAGMSVAAGFPDFRDKESGVYAKIKRQHGMFEPERIFMADEYERKPGPLCLWLQEFLEAREKATPTAAHVFLQLLNQKGSLLRCYTQNIDGLELTAGLPRERVVMAHGNMLGPSCVTCGTPYQLSKFESQVRAGEIPLCEKAGCTKPVRPGIVFFAEPTNIPHDFQKDFDACDLLLIVGTSLKVNPFANLASRVPVLCPRLLINRDKVFIANCRHRSRQLDFDSPKAYRDVFLGGDCDESIRFLSSQLGWHSNLLMLEAKFHKLVGRAAPPSPKDFPRSPPSGDDGSEWARSCSPTFVTSVSKSSPSSEHPFHSEDGVSVLSDGGLLAEACHEHYIPYESSKAQASAPKGLSYVGSHGSVASMVSELSAEAEIDMHMDIRHGVTGDITSL